MGNESNMGPRNESCSTPCLMPLKGETCSPAYVLLPKLKKTKFRGLNQRASNRPPLAGEVNANFYGWRVLRGHRDGSLRPYSRISRPEPHLYLISSPYFKFVKYV
jgi:hypothetical protein